MHTPSSSSVPHYDIVTNRLQKPSHDRNPPYAPSKLQVWAANNDKSVDDVSKARFDARLNAHLDDYKRLDHVGNHPQLEPSAFHRRIAHSDGMKDIRDAVRLI